VYKIVMAGSGIGAAFAACTWLVIFSYAHSDGPGGAMLSPRTSGLLMTATVLLGATSVCSWCSKHQADRTQRHFDLRIEQLRDLLKSDTATLLREEVTHVMPRLDANMLHTIQRGFRHEADAMLRAREERAFRANLVARAVAQVPPQPGHGRVLPIRRED
jgi:hypothetical protein